MRIKLLANKGLSHTNTITPTIYFYLVVLIAISLPLSAYVTSVAQLLLGVHWLIEGQFQRKWNTIKKDPLFWSFMVIPFVYLLGLVNTSNFNYALNDLKLKLPLFSLPLIIATSTRFTQKQLMRLLWLFTWALFAGSLISMGIYFGLSSIEVNDIRDISIFISHIRFSLMILFALCFLCWNLWKKGIVRPKKSLVLEFGLIVWFILFLGVLSSLTGWVILIILFYSLIILYFKTIKSSKIRYAFLFTSSLLPIIVCLFVAKVYKDYNTIKPVNFSELPTHTVLGNKYYSDTTKTTTIQGYYYNILICWPELEEGWNKISNIPFDSVDKNGYPIKYKVVRYLTSMGTTKDMVGIKQLDNKDIALIEKGNASILYKNKFIPYIKVYESIYDLDIYHKTGNANNKSISMRFEFFDAGIELFKQNFWTGVGTGDIKGSYLDIYKKRDSSLKRKNYHQAHNQYLTFAVTFGVIGFLACMYGMFFPIYVIKPKSFLLVSFSIIIFTSMLNEDTITTQAGVTFYALFYSLLTFNNKELE